MTILAIDPGTTQSAWVLFDPDTQLPVEHGLEANEDLLVTIEDHSASEFVIEMVASYGMPVGAEVFETCVWIGRFIEAWERTWPGRHYRLFRREVKLHLCGDSRAKDSNIRQALLDRYGPGRELAIGKKMTPGPLYGFKSDLWAALAVAITWAEWGKQHTGGGK